MLLRSGLGSPTDIAVVREATAALNSIFPATELGTFLALDRKDKERQLAELTSLVTGIRLFNKVWTVEMSSMIARETEIGSMQWIVSTSRS